MDILPFDVVVESIRCLPLEEIWELYQQQPNLWNALKLEVLERSNTYEPYLFAIDIDDGDLLRFVLKHSNGDMNLDELAEIALNQGSLNTLIVLLESIDVDDFEFLSDDQWNTIQRNPEISVFFENWLGSIVDSSNEYLLTTQAFTNYLQQLQDPSFVDKQLLVTPNIHSFFRDVIASNGYYNGPYSSIVNENPYLAEKFIKMMIDNEELFPDRCEVWDLIGNIIKNRSLGFDWIVSNIDKILRTKNSECQHKFIHDVFEDDDSSKEEFLQVVKETLGYIPDKI